MLLAVQVENNHIVIAHRQVKLDPILLDRQSLKSTNVSQHLDELSAARPRNITQMRIEKLTRHEIPIFRRKLERHDQCADPERAKAEGKPPPSAFVM